MSFCAAEFYARLRDEKRVEAAGKDRRINEQGEGTMTDRGVAIVTGGASGIGLATARALLADGWKIMIADLTHAGLEAARAELDALRANATKYVLRGVATEASVIAGLDGCEDGFGPVRGLVNSAGIARDVPFFETSGELFLKDLVINIIHPFTARPEH